jgi:5-methyltetrahydrofolate--homocysteine methyltransferase
MGTSIQKYNLRCRFRGKEGCNDYLVMVKPSVVEEVHAGYLEVGADVIETNTFGGNRLKMEEYGLGPVHMI